ncbi:hypothetical protein V7S43_004073 [Phytophthora oleae]|uniref:Uncharacterized protein n=1 Tax=Phytophthora oleae TaxID=2107226 RepID=A0ABD3FVX4_9STRA
MPENFRLDADHWGHLKQEKKMIFREVNLTNSSVLFLNAQGMNLVVDCSCWGSTNHGLRLKKRVVAALRSPWPRTSVAHIERKLAGQIKLETALDCLADARKRASAGMLTL